MSLPRQHREEIQLLARRWQGLNREGARGEKINRLATGLIVLCGAPLIIFAGDITRETSSWMVTIPTAAFVWGGWYKMYRVGKNRRALRADADEINTALQALCGEEAHFAEGAPGITIGEQTFDPFSDSDYE
ncbi:MAG: hypothetical protein V3R85_07400 [Alphaproteobacteria bacterium]